MSYTITHDVRHDCKGPNVNCRREHKAGRTVHVIEASWNFPRDSLNKSMMSALVMPSWHFTTAEEGIAALIKARATAVTITTDEELYAAREARVPHLLPVGWVDPSMRRA